MAEAEAQLRALGELPDAAVPAGADEDEDLAAAAAADGVDGAVDTQPGVRQALQGLDRRLRASGKSDAELAAEQEALFARMRAELERSTGGPVGPVRVEDVTDVYRCAAPR